MEDFIGFVVVTLKGLFSIFCFVSVALITAAVSIAVAYLALKYWWISGIIILLIASFIVGMNELY